MTHRSSGDERSDPKRMVAAILRERRCAIRAVQPFGPPIRTRSEAQRAAAFHVALDRAAEAEREPVGSV